MSSILDLYRKHVNSLTNKEDKINESNVIVNKNSKYQTREELMLKGENRRNTYSLEKICSRN